MTDPAASQPARFLDDLLAKPAALARLGATLAVPGVFRDVPMGLERVVLLGMGSSRYAAEVTAARLRAAGVHAVAELASAEAGTVPGPSTLAIAISATGGSVETLVALDRHRGRSRIVAITNRPGAPVSEGADAVLDLAAGEETGGVACRTFQHTLLVLRALEAHLGGEPVAMGPLIDGAAHATEHLLATRDTWLPAVDLALDGPDGVQAIAPAERWSSALQSALMVREGPRRPATGSETGDWSHVEVYLTRTRDYRALFFPGSRWDAPALDWLTQRRSTWVAVGGEVRGAAVTVRYPGDTDAGIALATETLVAELLAQRWWARQEAAAVGA